MTSAGTHAPPRLVTLATGLVAGLVAVGGVEGYQAWTASRPSSWDAQPVLAPRMDCGGGESVGAVYDAGDAMPVGEPTLRLAAERWRRTFGSADLVRAGTYRLEGYRDDEAVQVTWSTAAGAPRAVLTVARVRRGRWYVTGAERCA